MRLWIFGILLIAPHFAAAQQNEQALPKKTRILFLLDASGSMLGEWDGGVKMEVAKRILVDLVDSLATNKQLELAFRAYGHQYHRRLQNCEDSRLEVGFRPDNHTEIKQRLLRLTPQGTTPLAYSLQQAASDFPSEEGYRNIMILITDGIESCDGDPCAVSLNLQRQGVYLKPFVIGLGVARDYTNRLDCLGEYFNANSLPAFRQALNQALRRSLEPTTVKVELLDANQQPTVSNLNVTFLNNFTGQAAFEFVHWRDSQGHTDAVEVDAVLNYDVQVNTLPPVMVENVQFTPGQENVLRIQCPTSALTVQMASAGSYESAVQVLVRAAGKADVLNSQALGKSHHYLQGNYDLEVLTLPRRYFKAVDLSRDQYINLPAPGQLSLDATGAGYGSLYELNEQGLQRWIADLPQDQSRINLAMQPGRYKVVFRSKQAQGSQFTKIREFTISSGRTSNVRVF